jgi:hypothetical protein
MLRIKQVEEDFANVCTFFTQQGLIRSPLSGNIRSVAKVIHQSTYSLIWWRFKLPKMSLNKSVFIWEIASDALQILPQALMGYSKTTKLLTRCIIENVFRHIYYSDHPVEFEKLSLPSKSYMPYRELLEYIKVHPIYEVTEKKFDAISRLSNLYGELSNFVHGVKSEHMEMRRSLKAIRLTTDNILQEARHIKKCTESANFILAIYHKDIFARKPLEDKCVITQTLSRNARQILAGIK